MGREEQEVDNIPTPRPMQRLAENAVDRMNGVTCVFMMVSSV
jgi:hypothetical protein